MAKGKKEEGIRGFQGILSAALIISALLSIGANLFMTPLLALLGTTEADGALFAVSRTYLQTVSYTHLIPLLYLRRTPPCRPGKEKSEGWAFYS